MGNTDPNTNRCTVCGKFIHQTWDSKLCPKHEAISKMFDQLNNQIFELEETLYQLEKSDVCKPLYRMRINLAEIQEHFRNGFEVCDYIPTLDLII
jgi:hypothetical protein